MRKLHGCCVLLLMLVSSTVFADSPFGDKYNFMCDNNPIYLEMEIALLESVLGQPDEVVRYNWQDPNHAYDLVGWKYGGVWVYFNDLTLVKNGWKNYVEYIVLDLCDKDYTFGEIVAGTIKEIESIYGDPERIERKDDHLIYRYYIERERFIHYVLDFWFDSSGSCVLVSFDAGINH